MAVAIWGATPIATKIAVSDLEPVVVGMLRTVLAAGLATALLLAQRIGPPHEARQIGLLAMVTGGSLIAFPLLFSLGVGRTSAAHAGLILAALPVPTGLLGAAIERRRPPWTWWVGAAIALVGEVVLISLGADAAGPRATVSGDLLVAAGGLSAAAGHVAGARLAPSLGTWPTTFWAITLAGGVLLGPLVWQGATIEAGAVSAAAWLAVLFLALGSTLLAFAAWYWALSRGGIARMGAMQFLQPLVTLTLAATMLGEPLTPGLISAAAVILAGVALTQRRWQRAAG